MNSGPAQASAEGWTCEASAPRAQILTAPPVEPAVANRGASCREAGGGGEPPGGQRRWPT